MMNECGRYINGGQRGRREKKRGGEGKRGEKGRERGGEENQLTAA